LSNGHNITFLSARRPHTRQTVPNIAVRRHPTIVLLIQMRLAPETSIPAPRLQVI
jgi:hypothetical protein